MEDESQIVYYKVAEAADLPGGERLFLEVDNIPVVIFNIAGQLFAIGDVCTHDNGPLGDGELDGFHIVCPRHGARFDIRTGQAVKLPAVKNAPSFPVRVCDGVIEIGVPVK